MSDNWRYCGPPGRGVISLARDWLRGGAHSGWDQLSPGHTEMAGRCTTAIRLVLDSWSIGPGDEVLMPSYHCGSEVDAVLATGAKVVLYRIFGDLSIDDEDALRRITSKTRVLYVIHYFGWPQRLDRLASGCRDAGVKMLEDCALSLFSRSGALPIGAFGDAAVFSLRKTLGVTDGGAAVWREPKERRRAVVRPAVGSTLRRSMSMIRNEWVRKLCRLGLSRSAKFLTRCAAYSDCDAEGKPPPIPAHYYFDVRERGRRISRGALGAAGRTNAAEILQTRRRNYTRLVGALKGLPFRPAFSSLPEGVCPLLLPVIGCDRDAVVVALRQRGIDAIAWWAGYHRTADLTAFEEARRLKDHVVALPVHQHLTDDDIDYIAACVRGTGDAGAAETGGFVYSSLESGGA